MLRRQSKCEWCDKTVNAVDARGMCDSCKIEFDTIRTTRFQGCKDCPTPVSCVMKRGCLKEPDRPAQGELFAKEY